MSLYRTIPLNAMGRVSIRSRGSFPGGGGPGRRIGAQRAARSRLFSRTRVYRNSKRGTSGAGVTTQHDARRIYVKRRMPRFKRKRWSMFKKKVQAVSEKSLGSRTVVFNKSIQWSNTTSGNQVLGALYLYGQRGSTGNAAQDLYLISTYENTGDQTALAGETVANSSKFMFQSAVLDITFKNNSTYTAAGPVVQSASEAKLEVDVYECSVRRTTEETSNTLTDFLQLLADNASRTDPIGGAGTEIASTLRGVTPFDLTYAMSRWGVKIWKKTKYTIPNNDTFTYQVRDPRRRVAEYRDLQNADGFNRPGWTRVVFFTAKLVPDLSVGAAVGTYQENLITGVTRKYFYKIEGMSEDRTRYVTT